MVKIHAKCKFKSAVSDIKNDIWTNAVKFKIFRISQKIMKEVQNIAKAEGVNNTEKMIDEALVSFNKMIPDGKTSMLQDVEAGRKPK